MRVLTVCLLGLAAAGCSSQNPYGSSTHAVSGRLVGPAGEVVKGGAEVVLVPKAVGGGIFGREGSGLVGPDGSFVIKTADGEAIPGGTYQVVVRPYGKATSEKTAAARAIPKKYWLEDSTDLVVEVTADKAGWELRLAK